MKEGKGAKSWIVLAAAVFLAALAAGIFMLMPSGSRIVEVVQDGVVLYTIDLDSADDTVLTVFYPRESSAAARSNTIIVQDGEIWVSEAECPDHICVKMGKLRSGRLPIVCLPNHLMIRFTE